MFTEDDFILWLTKIENINLKKKIFLVENFESGKNLFYADEKDLINFCKINEIDFKDILLKRDEKTLKKYIDEIKDKNINFISKYNKKYPSKLSEAYDSPLGIYFIGDIPDNKFKKVSVIGSRKCTQYGSTHAYKFSKELAQNGVVIVSGLAMGIDALSHKGAIDGGGKTIAVVGCGLDIIYPSSNRELREKIIKNGCIISEYSPGTPPIPSNFPIRNRIISGLCEALIVVEAAQKSGTLITVNYGLEYGRSIFALPGNITSYYSTGTNNLIKDGAYPITETKDILINLGINTNNKNNIYEKEKNIFESLEQNEKLVYSFINYEPITIDEIVIKSNCQIQTISYVLTMLEFKGIVKKISGQKYIKAL